MCHHLAATIRWVDLYEAHMSWVKEIPCRHDLFEVLLADFEISLELGVGDGVPSIRLRLTVRVRIRV